MICLLKGCSQNYQQEEKLNPKIIESIKIPLTDRISARPFRTQYIDSDSGQYLALMNKIGSSIEIFDLKDGKNIKSIKFLDDGPNSIGMFGGFTIKSIDSIFTATITPPGISLFDFNSKKLKSYKVPDFDQPFQSLFSFNTAPFLIESNLIHFSYPYFTDFWGTSFDDFDKFSHAFIFDIEGETFTKLPLHYPLKFWEKGKKRTEFSWLTLGDSIIISPFFDENVWIFSKKIGQKIAEIRLESKNLNEFAYFSELPEGNEGIIKELNSGSFTEFLYDPYRKLIYRFYQLPIDPDNYEFDVYNLLSNAPNIGIMVLNEKLEVLGEVVFKDFKIDSHSTFVGKKGLYVSKNNENSMEFDENFLKYDIILFEDLNDED